MPKEVSFYQALKTDKKVRCEHPELKARAYESVCKGNNSNEYITYVKGRYVDMAEMLIIIAQLSYDFSINCGIYILEGKWSIND